MKNCYFPAHVRGFITEQEGDKLAELSLDCKVIEFGSFCGRSTICMAQTAKYVVSVDPHDLPQPDTLHEMIDNVRGLNLSRKIIASRCRSSDIHGMWPARWFDMAFHDASHFYPEMFDELEQLKSLVRPGGIVVCHDYNETWPGVKRSCDKAFPNVLPDLCEQLAIFRLP